MIAIVIHERGGPEQFVCEQVPDPRPKKGEVLVRVHAAGVTPTELTWETTYRTRDGASRLPSIRVTNFPVLCRLQPMAVILPREMPFTG
jgi:NADPH:quinone reductase-like Zn-dependent oxidoreductase